MMKEGNCIVNHEETNILFVEDDATICKSLPPILETYGYKVKNVNTYMQAIQTIKADNFDLYLIDIHIPGGDGFELCRMIRKQENTPVIFLTGVNDEASIVFGLGLGADDHITKPFTLQVLLARIKTVLRRNQRDVNKARKVKSGNLIIDFDHRTVHSEGKEIAVTPTQFHILKLLVSNHGITITRDQITSILWNQNDEFVEDNTLSVHISNLKSKIGKFNGKPYLESVRGVGYQWKLDVVLYTD